MGFLEGKVVVVTGAGRGIGRAQAVLFAREGAKLLLNDAGVDQEGRGHDPSVVEAVHREIVEAGGAAVTDHQDVTESGVAEQLVAQAMAAFGRIDGVVANAGFSRDRTVLNLADEDLDAMLNVHVRAGLSLMRAAVNAFVAGKQPGSIVLTAAPQAFSGAARQAALAASAGAVVGLARSAAVELRKHGIRVNVLASTARTRLTEHLPLFRSVAPTSMLPEHVAPVAAYLLSDFATDVTGEVFGIAGGRVYALRSRETAGAVSETRPFEPNELVGVLREITRSDR